MSLILKIVAIVGTAIGGVYGTLYDFKKDGRLTNPGRFAICGILLSAALAIGTQFIDSAAESERLKEENDRQSLILQNTNNTVAGLNRTIDQLTQVRKDVSGSTDNLTKALKSQSADLARQEQMVNSIDASIIRAESEVTGGFQTLNGAVKKFNQSTDIHLARLSRPLRQIAFSYDLVYEHADKLLPNYYSYLQSVWLDGKYYSPSDVTRYEHGVILWRQSTLFPKTDDILADSVLNSAAANVNFILQPSSDPSLEYETAAWHGSKSTRLEEELASGNFTKMSIEPSIELEANFEMNTLTKRVLFSAVSLRHTDDTFTSELDFLKPTSPESIILELRLHSKSFAPRLTQVTIHFRPSYTDSVSIDGTLCSREEGGNFKCRIRHPSRQ